MFIKVGVSLTIWFTVLGYSGYFIQAVSAKQESKKDFRSTQHVSNSVVKHGLGASNSSSHDVTISESSSPSQSSNETASPVDLVVVLQAKPNDTSGSESPTSDTPTSLKSTTTTSLTPKTSPTTKSTTTSTASSTTHSSTQSTTNTTLTIALSTTTPSTAKPTLSTVSPSITNPATLTTTTPSITSKPTSIPTTLTPKTSTVLSPETSSSNSSSEISGSVSNQPMSESPFTNFSSLTTESPSKTTPATAISALLLAISVVVVVSVAVLLIVYIIKKRKDTYVPCTLRSCRGWMSRRTRTASTASQGPLTMEDPATFVVPEPKDERELFSIGDLDGGEDGRPRTRSRRGTEDDYFYDEIFERSAFVDERTNKLNNHLTVDSADDDDELEIPDLVFKKPSRKY